mgnify:CR=1 FL=1
MYHTVHTKTGMIHTVSSLSDGIRNEGIGIEGNHKILKALSSNAKRHMSLIAQDIASILPERNRASVGYCHICLLCFLLVFAYMAEDLTKYEMKKPIYLMIGFTFFRIVAINICQQIFGIHMIHVF